MERLSVWPTMHLVCYETWEPHQVEYVTFAFWLQIITRADCGNLFQVVKLEKVVPHHLIVNMDT